MHDASDNSPTPAEHDSEQKVNSEAAANAPSGGSDEPSADLLPVNSGRRRQLTIVGIGTGLALVLIIIVLNIGSPAIEPESIATDTRDAPIELIGPEAMREGDLARSGSVRDLSISDMTVAGGWIQITDEEGQLAQQYRFDQLDPDPNRGPGWAQMTEPEAQLLLSNNRVVILSGDEALAYLPSRALESGTLRGNVTITLYELDTLRSVDPQRDVPALTITTQQAEFDGVLGEVYAPGQLRISATHLEMPGRELRILFNDLDQQLSLRLSAVDFVQLDAATLSDAGSQRGAAVGLDDDEPAAQRAATGAVDVDRMYQLALTDNVRIIQHVQGGQQEMHGDQLTAVFSAQSQGIGDAFASALGRADAVPAMLARRAPQNSPAAVLNTQQAMLTAMVAATPGAQMQDGTDDFALEPGQTLITLDGPLTIQPWASARSDAQGVALRDADDVHVTMIGSPVMLRDTVESADASCASFVYQRRDDKIEMFAAGEHRVEITSPQLAMEGEHFLLARREGHARLTGAGWLQPQDNGQRARQDQQAIDDQPMQFVRELHVTWQSGVDLRFAPAQGGGRIGELNEVHFAGDVAVQSQDGDIFCDELLLELTLDAAGDPAPSRMLATGQVKTRDEMRTMWADALTVDFQQVDADEQQPQRDRDESGNMARISDRTLLRHLHATGDVQVLLSDGSRAFADELVGDGLEETLTLRGEHVIIASGRMLIDRGRSIRFDAQSETGHWDGPGQLSFYNEVIHTDADERIERPAINHEQSPPVVRARWNSSLTYDNKANDGAGAVSLLGDVFAESMPDPLEYNRLEGEEVRLDFTLQADDVQQESPDEQATDFALPNRQLERFTARTNARLENRTWRTEDRSDRPRVFYVAGQHLQYNDRTFESRIIGAGELLMRDTWVDPTNQGVILQPGERAIARDDAAGSEGAFRGKGTSLFRWQDELTMLADPTIENGYEITMRGDVSAIHRDLDSESATLTGNLVQALLLQVPTEARESARGDHLDLGGAFALRRIEGKGSVAVEARRHTVMCDRFAYDIGTGIAQADAQPGQRVSVLTTGSPHPLQAASILWDMTRDVITIQRGTGGR